MDHIKAYPTRIINYVYVRFSENRLMREPILMIASSIRFRNKGWRRGEVTGIVIPVRHANLQLIQIKRASSPRQVFGKGFVCQPFQPVLGFGTAEQFFLPSL